MRSSIYDPRPLRGSCPRSLALRARPTPLRGTGHAPRRLALGLALAAALTGAAELGCSKAETPREAGAPPSPIAMPHGNVDPPPAAAASKESHVYQVKSSKDLLDLRDQYAQAAAAGFTGTFEVQVAAGTYEPAVWSLAPDPTQPAPAIDLVLRGDGAVIPRPARLVARSVRIEGLVLTGSVSASIEIDVSQALTLRGSAVIDGRTVDPNARAPYLVVRARAAGGVRSPVTVAVEQSWFVRNFQGKKPAALLALAAHPSEPGYFGEVAIRDSVFLGNAFTSELEIAATQRVTIERSLFYKTWPAGVFIASAAPAVVTIADSVLVGEDLAQIASVGDGATPIELTGSSRILTTSYTAQAAIPAALKVDRAALADRSGLAAGAAAIDAAVKMPAALPDASLRTRLEQALRP